MRLIHRSEKSVTKFLKDLEYIWIISGAALLMQKQRSKCSLMRTNIMQSQQVKDCENLGSLPFVVLEELFDKYSLDTPDGK